MRKLLFATAVTLALFSLSSARADVSFQYVTDATSYTTTAGSNVSVNVYLQETDTNGSSSILAAQGGLLSYGFYVAGGTTAGQSVINTSLNATASTNGAFTTLPHSRNSAVM